MRLQRIKVMDGAPSTDREGSGAGAPLPAAFGPTRRASVLLGIGDLGLHQEVLDHLERDPRIEVVGATTEADQLATRLREQPEDPVVACPALAADIAAQLMDRRGPVFVVTQEMTVPVLREAIDAGAQGVYAWPDEREELADAIRSARAETGTSGAGRDRVIAVNGARGGAGATFLATHLAAALADRGLEIVLVDFDSGFSDVTAALGIAPSDEARTIADLLPVMDELSPDHVEQVLFRHPRGFPVLLGPPADAPAGAIPIGLVRGCVALLAGGYRVVVLNVPHALDTVTRAAVELADEVVLVASLDLFSIYGAKRAISALDLDREDGRCRVVVNRKRRADISLADVERVVGIKPTGTIRFDRAVGRAQDRGEFVHARSGGAWKDVVRLAGVIASTVDTTEPAVDALDARTRNR